MFALPVQVEHCVAVAKVKPFQLPLTVFGAVDSVVVHLLRPRQTSSKIRRSPTSAEP